MTKLFVAALAICSLAAIVALDRSGIDVGALTTAGGSMTYTDRDGIALGTILGPDSNRSAGVPLRAVSPAFLDAIVAAEDARFWRHGATDIRSLLRAAREYVIYGEARSGGSTIEMQLARLLTLREAQSDTRQGQRENQWRVKLAQIAMAYRIEIASPKSAILEAYVNRVPMGGNVYGVEAAARTYFAEPASDLDVAQAALLAAIPNDPARLSPGNDWPALRARQRYVLTRMADLNFISRAEADRAFSETLNVRGNAGGIADAPHALFFLDRGALPPGGRVRTTLDRDLQRFVQAQTHDVVAALGRFNVSDGAALVVDNHTGDVLAYVGSPDYFSDADLGRNDGVQALRQPGSSLKPFTYELALERGMIRSTTILNDAPVAYAMPNGGLYQPVDYSGRFSGPVRVRYALANSLNAPAVQVLSKLGVGVLLDRLHELGFTHLQQPPSFYGLGLTLGSGEVSLWELVQAYSALARGGDFRPLHLTDDDAAPIARAIGERADWALVTDMLADPHARAKSFGLHSVLQMPFPAAVKTGTSSDFRDTWTVGYTRDYTVGTWVGNFDGAPMRGVSGVTGAGPLWNRIMLHLYERNDDPPPFEPPRGFVRAAICAATGRAPSPSSRDCGAVVQEWVRPQQLARSAPVRERQGLRILFPRDGDVFVRNTGGTALQDREQELALRAGSARGALRWSVGGIPAVLDSSGDAFWPLRLGTWTVEARDGLQHDRVTIHVVAPWRSGRAGFTFAPVKSVDRE